MAPPTARGPRQRPWALLLTQLALALTVLGAWEAYGRVHGEGLTSMPSLVGARLLSWAGDDLYIHVTVTLAEVLAGLTLGTAAGVSLGLLLGRMPNAGELARPIIVAMYSVPMIALAPLLIMLFGLDLLPKIVLVTLVVFFLLFFNTFSGAQAVDEDMVSSLRLMGSNSLEDFRMVIAPGSLIWIIGGIKVALPYTLVAATTAEMLASRRGLGWLLVQSSSQYDITGVYAVLAILTVLGLVISESASQLEQWLLRWRAPSR